MIIWGYFGPLLRFSLNFTFKIDIQDWVRDIQDWVGQGKTSDQGEVTKGNSGLNVYWL